MRVGLDLRPSLARPTGVGSYVLALAQRLPALAPDDRFFYFSASLRDRYAQKSWPKNVTLVDRRLPVRALNLAWNRLEWPTLDRLVGSPLDLVHSPHPLLLPSKRAKKIVTLHDLFFLKHPEMTDAEIRRDYPALVRDHHGAADPRAGLLGDGRDPRAHGRLRRARAPVPRGGVRPARSRGHGRRASRGVLARVGAGGGRGRRGHARQPPRYPVHRGRDREHPRQPAQGRGPARAGLRAQPALQLGRDRGAHAGVLPQGRGLR